MKFTNDYEQIHPGCCGGSFAVPDEIHKVWLNERKGWFCPYCGSGRVFTGKSEEQKLREQLQQTQRNYEAQAGRAAMLERQRDGIKRAHQKMRDRVKNGVCPCCNRTFQNFMEHMKTQHPEFGKEQTFKALRDAFGLTQSAVAQEIGVSAPYVSSYERGKYAPEWATRCIESWVKDNTQTDISG